MTRLRFTQRAKYCYAAALLVFLCSLGLVFTGHMPAGVVGAVAAFGFAFGVAGLNGHLTTRKPEEDP
jgi:hypothetical protein